MGLLKLAVHESNLSTMVTAPAHLSNYHALGVLSGRRLRHAAELIRRQEVGIARLILMFFMPLTP